MNVRQLLAVAATASLLVPGTALAGKGNGKPSGKPEGNPAPATTVSIRTLEGPVSSPEIAPVPTTETPEVIEVPAPTHTKTRGKSAQAKADARARKAAKRACKGLSKKHRKGTKASPYSRCIVAAAKRRKQPVEPIVEPAPEQPATPIETEPTQPPVSEPAPTEPTEPVQPTDPVESPIS